MRHALDCADHKCEDQNERVCAEKCPLDHEAHGQTQRSAARKGQECRSLLYSRVKMTQLWRERAPHSGAQRQRERTSAERQRARNERKQPSSGNLHALRAEEGTAWCWSVRQTTRSTKRSVRYTRTSRRGVMDSPQLHRREVSRLSELGSECRTDDPGDKKNKRADPQRVKRA